MKNKIKQSLHFTTLTLDLFFRLCYFLLFFPNLLFFCHIFYFYYFIFFCFLFFFLLSFALFLFISFLLSLSSLLSFVFVILVSPALASTIFSTSLGILSFSLLLFSSQSQNCGEPTMVFPKLYSTFDLQSYQSLFSPYVFSNKYLSPPYA